MVIMQAAPANLQAFARALGGVVSGAHVLAPGPGHSAADRSLSIKLDPGAPDGFVVHSFSGDDPIVCKDYVREKLGLPAFKPNGRSRVSDEPIAAAVRAAVGTQRPNGKIVASYDYTDADGALLYQVQRLEPKDFRQRRPDGNGGWIYKLNERRVLYRWPELLKFPDATIFVTEGEKDADCVADLNLCATTVAAGKWTDECVKALAGRDVIILEDNDSAGRAKALAAAQALHGTAKTIRIVALPGLPDKGDVSDWLGADPRRAGKFCVVCFDVPEWTPTTEKSVSGDLFMSTAEFVVGFTPPDYLIDGLIQRRYLYALTAPTGTGKTAIGLRLAVHVDFGLPLAGREVDPGKVLFFAGENPDDVRMRFIKLLEEVKIDPKASRIFWRAGGLKLSDKELRKRIDAETAKQGPFALVIVDTSAAFFEGDDENSNSQLGAHARMLRTLVDLPGGPTVIVTCHPTKNPNSDNLLPRGGGAFIAEIDGNLVCIKQPDSQIVELHWHGKFRGPDFAPIPFMITVGKSARLVDSKGRAISTVTAHPVSQLEVEEADSAARFRQDRLLTALQDNPSASLAALAKAVGWSYQNGEPNKTLVNRTLKALQAAHLIKKEGHRWVLTKSGEKAEKHCFNGETAKGDN